jgi:hypothetical protein
MINLVNTQRLRGLDVGERPKVGAVLEVSRRRRRLPDPHGPHLAAHPVRVHVLLLPPLGRHGQDVRES